MEHVWHRLRELALVSVIVVLTLAIMVGSFALPKPYDVILHYVWYAGTLIVLAFLIVRWFIRRRRH